MIWRNEILVDIDKDDFEGYTVRLEDDEPFSFRADYQVIDVRHPQNWAIIKGDIFDLDLGKFRFYGVVEEVERLRNPERWQLTIYNIEQTLKKTCLDPYSNITGRKYPKHLKYILEDHNYSDGASIVPNIDYSAALVSVDNISSFAKITAAKHCVIDESYRFEIGFYDNPDGTRNTFVVLRFRGTVITNQQSDLSYLRVYEIDEGYADLASFFHLDYDLWKKSDADVPELETIGKYENLGRISKGDEAENVFKYYQGAIMARMGNGYKLEDYIYLEKTDTLFLLATRKTDDTHADLMVFYMRDICSRAITNYYAEIGNVSFRDLLLDVCFLTDSVFRVDGDMLHILPRSGYTEDVDISGGVSLIVKGYPKQKQVSIDAFDYQMRVVRDLPDKYIQYRNDYYNSKAAPFKTEIEGLNGGALFDVDILDRVIDGAYIFGTVYSKKYSKRGSRVTLEIRRDGEPDYWRAG